MYLKMELGILMYSKNHLTPDTKFDKNVNLKYLLIFKNIFKGN